MTPEGHRPPESRVEGAYKAQGIGDQQIDSAVIVLDVEMPRYESIAESVQTFEADASALAKVLCETLPGGTLDRLIGKLLAKKATSLVVPLFDKEKDS